MENIPQCLNANNICSIYTEVMVLFQSLVYVLVQDKSVLVKILHRNRTNRRYVYIDRDREIEIEIERFITRHWLMQTGSWEVPRSVVGKLETSGISSSLKASSLENPKKQMFQSQSKGQKRTMSPIMQSDKRSSLLLSLFILFRSSIDWMRPTHTAEGNLLYSGYQFKC